MNQWPLGEGQPQEGCFCMTGKRKTYRASDLGGIGEGEHSDPLQEVPHKPGIFISYFRMD